MLIRALALSAALAAPVASHSMLVQDGITLKDTETGLTWLNLTATQNMGIAEVAAALEPGGMLFGWRFAYGTEVATLVDHANVVLGPHYGNDYLNFQTIRVFQSAIGITRAPEDNYPIENDRITQGFYKNSGTQYGYGLFESWTYYGDFNSAALLLDNTIAATHPGSDAVGSFLVLSSVPEVGTAHLALAGFGLLGLLMRRRKL